MKHTVLTIWCSLLMCYGYTQTNVPEYYRFSVYLDNLLIGNESKIDCTTLPKVLFENYYSKCIDCNTKLCVPEMIKKIYLEKDTTFCNENSLHIRTKKVKDGYLFVNKLISEKIQECCSNFENVSVSYVYNGKIISTKEDVKKLLKLRKKKLKILSVTEDKENSVVIINFTDK